MTSTNRLIGKNVLITGASSGIGEATAIEFSKQGSNLILAARRIDKLQKLKSKINAEFPSVLVKCLSLDLRKPKKEIVQIIKTIEDPVDVLVNNAGLVVGMETIESVDEKDYDTMFDTNVRGLLCMIQAVLPGMKERGKGHIINVSSIAGHETYPGGGIYCATKHAVDAITRTLRMELINTPINVTSVDPGLVETEFSIIRFRGDEEKARGVYSSLNSLPLSGEDVAETIVFCAGRKEHVQIANVVIFPTCQASVSVVAKK